MCGFNCDIDDLVKQPVANRTTHADRTSFMANYDSDHRVWQTGLGSRLASSGQSSGDAQPSVIVHRGGSNGVIIAAVHRSPLPTLIVE